MKLFLGFCCLAMQLPAQAPQATQGSKAPAPRAGLVRYRGFSIDARNLAGNPNRDTVLASVRAQVALVEAVRMDTAKKKFLRTIPIVILAEADARPRYTEGKISVPAQVVDKARPVILHELMHAYHERRLPGGFENPSIQSMYDQAQAGGKFPVGSYMLTNRGEYFAMMSSVFLHGSAARDPFARDSIRVKQPDMYAWLVREFGPRR